MPDIKKEVLRIVHKESNDQEKLWRLFDLCGFNLGKQEGRSSIRAAGRIYRFDEKGFLTRVTEASKKKKARRDL